MNLIPQKPLPCGNYVCTWSAQGRSLAYKDLHPEDDLKRAPQGINEAFLFAKNGYLDTLDPEIRGDLVVVLDDGWDVPLYKEPDSNNAFQYGYFHYGSMIPNAERFPSFPGTPAERLKGISDKVKEMGLFGLGLWVAPQVSSDVPCDPSAKQAEPYWRERFTWCNEADIKYLKVDWGFRAGDSDYREMMTRVAKEVAPGMKIEHSLNQGSLDYRRAFRDKEPWHEGKRRYIERMMYACDFFRTYDVTGAFADMTAMERAGEAMSLIQHPENAIAIPSMEDSVYAAAGIGGTFGAMRFDFFSRRTDKDESRCPTSEMKRAIMWSRMAPPFPIKETPFEINSEYGTDRLMIGGTPIFQDCCLSLSRNMPLPEVKPLTDHRPVPTYEVPYVICSHNPYTDATAVYAMPRSYSGRTLMPVRADVKVACANEYAPVGIFGWYNTLDIDFAVDIRYKRVWAQDLCTKEAVDITDLVDLAGHNLILKGDLIDKIGLTVKESKYEMPGMVVVLEDKYDYHH